MDLLTRILKRAIEIRDLEEYAAINDETKQVFDILYKDSKKNVSSDNSSETEEKRKTDENLVEILLPGSHGWARLNRNQEFIIEDVFVHHKHGLRYRVKYLDETEASLPIGDNIAGLEGVSTYGYYDLETGKTIEIIDDGL
jgi:hypothetical protein